MQTNISCFACCRALDVPLKDRLTPELFTAKNPFQSSFYFMSYTLFRKALKNLYYDKCRRR